MLGKNTQVLQRKAVGWMSLAGCQLVNLSSHRQTLLSKVRDPKNLLEKTQLSGDKIGAMVLAVRNVPYSNGRGQRVIHSSSIS